MHLSKNDLYSETGKPSSVNRTSHLTLSPKTSILFSGVGGVVPSVRSVFRLEKTAVSYLGFWLERKEPCHASGGQWQHLCRCRKCTGRRTHKIKKLRSVRG